MLSKIFYFILFIPLFCNSQNKGNLSFEFTYNAHQYSMNKLNDFLIDTNYNDASLYSSHPEEQIKKGNEFSFSLGYQPFKFMELGLYGSYQSGKINRTPQLLYFDSETNEEIYYKGDYELLTTAHGFGIISSTYLNQLLNFENKSPLFLQRLLIIFEAQGGVGFSHLHDIISFNIPPPNNSFEFKNYSHKATNFQGQVALKFGYNYLKKSLSSFIGIKIGYQFFKTSTIINSVGKNLKPDNSINLNFSGFFIGTFLKLGK